VGVLWVSSWAIYPGHWLALLLEIGLVLSVMPRAKVSMKFSWTFHSQIGRGS
jgi:hypothetical protein